MKKYSKEFSIGLLVGLFGGVAGNILVNAMYRAIDGVPIGNNWLTFVLEVILFVFVLWFVNKNTE